MKVLVIFVGIVAGCLAIPVDKLHASELTEEIINNPRYIVYEGEDGLFEVEDLYDANLEPPTLFVTGENVTFYFFNHKNSETGVKINESQLHNIVKLTGFNTKVETLVIIHGWKNHGKSAVNDLIKTAALKNRNINVIVVDWSSIAKRGYGQAQGSVVAVGNYIGDFLRKLDDALKRRLEKVTIVGHSLGAHIAGNAGARNKKVVNTIIGLDPAGPLFNKSNINNRLDPTDAKYVQVIHTNDGCLGLNIKMGHADYYPNGGRRQAGCILDILGICSHNRAFQFYAESLNNDKFKSRICDSWSSYQRNICNDNSVSHLGGFPVQKSKVGNYYLTTNSRSPFAQG